MARPALGDLVKHADRRAQLPRRAVAALKTVLLDEGCLQWVQDIAVRQALDGHDLAAVRLHRQGQAGVHTLTVQQHGTGAACALVAALLRACHVQALAHDVQQRHARLEEQFVSRPVHDQADGQFRFHHAPFLPMHFMGCKLLVRKSRDKCRLQHARKR